MITKSWGKFLGVGSLFLIILYFLKDIIFLALLAGIIPIIIIFIVSIGLKYFVKSQKFRAKSVKDILITSVGLGASIGLVLYLILYFIAKIFNLK